VERDDAPGKLNRTAEYIRTYAPGSWDGSTVTGGPSALLHCDFGIFVREGRGRRLHLIKLNPAGPDAAEGDGVYATLYPVSW